MLYQSKSLEPNRKILLVRNRIHFLSAFELIVKKHSFLRICVRNTCLCIYELSSRLTNMNGDILYPSQLSTYPTEIYDPSNPIFTTSQKVPWATLKLFNWKPSPCVPMMDLHHVQSWFPETLIGTGLSSLTVTVGQPHPHEPDSADVQWSLLTCWVKVSITPYVLPAA